MTILLELDFRETKELFPVIKEKADALISEYYKLHTSITQWWSPRYNSGTGGYTEPFNKDVKFKYTDGEFLYYEHITYDGRRVSQILTHRLPVSWLFDDSWKNDVILQAEAYKAEREAYDQKNADDKKAREIKALYEMMDKYYEVVEEWAERNL